MATPIRPGQAGLQAALTLNYPMSLAVYDSYAEAQQAVDYLSDHEFPVQNVMIVGTDLKQIERVTGRLTRAKVATGGAMSGAWLGLFVGMMFELFTQEQFSLARVMSTVLLGIVFGLVWALIGYQLTGGNRDFTSVSQVVANKYEVLVEHKHVDRARELITQADPMKAAQEEVRRAQEADRAAHEASQRPAADRP